MQIVQHKSQQDDISALYLLAKLLPVEHAAADIGIFLEKLDALLPCLQWLINNDSAICWQKIRKAGFSLLFRHSAKRQDFHYIQLFDRQLGNNMKTADGIYLLVKKLDAAGMRAVQGEYIHDTAPDAEISCHLHLVAALIAKLYQLLQKLFPAKCHAGLQHQAELTVGIRADALLHGGLHCCQHHQPVSLQQPAQHLHAPCQPVKTFGGSIKLRHVQHRQLRHLCIRQQALQILPPAAQLLAAAGNNHHRILQIACRKSTVLLGTCQPVDKCLPLLFLELPCHFPD